MGRGANPDLSRDDLQDLSFGFRQCRRRGTGGHRVEETRRAPAAEALNWLTSTKSLFAGFSQTGKPCQRSPLKAWSRGTGSNSAAVSACRRFSISSNPLRCWRTVRGRERAGVFLGLEVGVGGELVVGRPTEAFFERAVVGVFFGWRDPVHRGAEYRKGLQRKRKRPRRWVGRP
jgi:hypothetical protein